MRFELGMPIGTFQGVLASLERLERRIARANRVVEAARKVNECRADVDGETYVGLREHVEALDAALGNLDREVERIRSRDRSGVVTNGGRA